MAEADDRKIFGEALRALRQELGVSQSAAAKAFGTTTQNWSKYELGKAANVFGPSIRSKLADAIGTTVEVLEDRCLRNIGAPSNISTRFPTAEGDVTIIYPGELSDLSRRQIAAYLAALFGR